MSGIHFYVHPIPLFSDNCYKKTKFLIYFIKQTQVINIVFGKHDITTIQSYLKELPILVGGT